MDNCQNIVAALVCQEMGLTKRIAFIGIAFLLTFASIYSMGFIHRRDYDKAYFSWYSNPTPENEAALQRERRINDEIRLRDSAVGATILLAIAYGVWLLLLRSRKESGSAAPRA